jgi:hypothetical protein
MEARNDHVAWDAILVPMDPPLDCLAGTGHLLCEFYPWWTGVLSWNLAIAGLMQAAIDRTMVTAFRALTDEQRCELMGECCKFCGTLIRPCYCMRDD